ncbi:MAG: hypothetical protein PHF86_05785 [Candidatus Nanoarchaeia archaeon]|nr:hypothetical protein [Candidatus Nanoarchaeia archaeon]
MVVTAAILFLGFKGIGYIKDTGNSVELANFVTNVRNNVEKNFNLGELSLTEANLAAPSQTVLVCFLDSSTNPNLSVIKDPILQKKISLLIKSKEENLYLVIISLGRPYAQALQHPDLPAGTRVVRG